MLVRLSTAETGRPIWINPEYVVSVQQDHRHGHAHTCLLSMAGDDRPTAILESVDRVAEALNLAMREADTVHVGTHDNPDRTIPRGTTP